VFRPPQYAEKYIVEIIRLHGIPKTIVSDRGSQFTAHFWEHLHKSMGTRLVHSTTYHPQTDGQTERVNDVLKICSELVCYRPGIHGNHDYLWQSLLTTIVIKRVSKWLYLKHCMVGSVGHR
jgi:transposase InsO family protein